MNDRTENRSAGCKTSNQSSNQTANQSTNRAQNASQNAANEHKHPNQYTKGADDESAKNASHASAKNSR